MNHDLPKTPLTHLSHVSHAGLWSTLQPGTRAEPEQPGLRAASSQSVTELNRSELARHSASTARVEEEKEFALGMVLASFPKAFLKLSFLLL